MTDILRLLGLMRPRVGWVLAGIVTTVLTTGAGIALFGLVGEAVMATVVGLTVGAGGTAAVLRALALARGGGRYAEKIATHQATFRVIADLRVWVFERAIPLAPRGLSRLRSGDMLSRMVSDIDALDGLYLMLLVPTVVALVLAVPVGWVLVAVTPDLAWLALGSLVLAGIGVPVVAERLGRRAGAEQIAATARLRVAVVDLVQGVADLVAHEAGGRQIAHVLEIEQDRNSAATRSAIVGALSNAATQALSHVVVVMVLVFGAVAVQGETATIQAVGIAVFIVLASFEAIAPLPLAYQMLGRTRTAGRRVLELADADPGSRSAQSEIAQDRSEAANTLTFKGVTLSYPKDSGASDRPAVRDVNLTIEAGVCVAITGPSGAGKSSLISLLLGFVDPTEGRVLLDGRDLSTLALEEVHARIGVLSQTSPILAGSLRENVTLSTPDIDDARLQRAMETAGLSDWIGTLPNGLDTWLGETGARVSGGQARRIALARVVLKDAPVLLLDEPTEGLEADTERTVLEALCEHMKGRTVLIVSHRPAATALADRVYRMEAGLLAASNDHGIHPE